MRTPEPVKMIGAMITDSGEIVYRPKTEAEAQRRVERSKCLQGLPFLHLPDNPPQHRILFEFHGVKVRVSNVEMVFNDALLMDAISNWGQDGPLYRDTLNDAPVMNAAFWWACEAYKNINLLASVKMPCCAALPASALPCRHCGRTE